MVIAFPTPVQVFHGAAGADLSLDSDEELDQQSAWGYELQYSNVVRHSSSVASNGSSSLRQCMFFLAQQAQSRKKPKNSVVPSRPLRKKDKVAAAMRLTKGGAAERNQKEREACRAAEALVANGDLLARAAELSSDSALSPKPEGFSEAVTPSITSTAVSETVGEGAFSQGGRPYIFQNLRVGRDG
ncbi:hypothetical protein P170DRAFT_478952 [Aspergillus steynii IBT 23096]|uniref:Uncharacterized protein n=1 Tax=Aspergillus steynii IBT 23096 TaxID=1392250 RepID=A0A2I2FZG7_9EURO|nr:uncharacterized protein P170DRAFT_478952 [Aspergillus steynii IBT 23096]PLB46028.1 hypothetical protein P170DRAFT_478952 [Aspergillus steynii IBT 23096]